MSYVIQEAFSLKQQLTEKDAKIESIDKELSRAKSELMDDCFELMKELKEAEEVIQFYADQINWKECESGSAPEYGTAIISHTDYEVVNSEWSGGKKAREYFKKRGSIE